MRVPHGLRAALAGQVSVGATDPNFSDVSLLMYGDGANGSTTFVDSSSNNFAITRAGNAQISTAQSKFGGASMYFDGSGDYLSVPDNAAFVFGTGDFTIEFWIRTTDTAGGLVTRIAGGAGNWDLVLNVSNVYFQSQYFANNLYNRSATAILDGNWHHLAACRSGTSHRLFFDGIQQGATVIDTNNYNGTGETRIGSDNYGDFNGYIDDLRITKGVARYTANFTPPTASFSTLTPSEPYFYNTSLLLHGDGTNGSTSITDSSNSALTFTNTGPVVVSTAQVKYGTGSLYFANNGHSLVSPSTSAFAFGTGDFTVEWWQRVVSPTWVYSFGAYFGIGVYGSGTNIAIGFLGGSIGVATQSAGALSQSTARGTDGVFHHVALTRSSSVTRFFYDGALIGTTDLTTGNFGNSILYLNRVSAYSNSGVSNGLYIDDLRITKGVARYTANFTPPTEPFPHL